MTGLILGSERLNIVSYVRRHRVGQLFGGWSLLKVLIGEGSCRLGVVDIFLGC